MIERPRTTLPGSERKAPIGSRATGPIDLDERAEVTIMVRAKEDVAEAAKPFLDGSKRQFLSHTELAAQFGADPADLERVAEFVVERGLTVVSRDTVTRTVVVTGTLRELSSAFGVHLEAHQTRRGSFRARTGSIMIPQHLAGIITNVHGLDTRPLVRSRRQMLAATAKLQTGETLATHYQFPDGVNGTGQCVAFIELGGGYRPSEIRAYIKSLGITVVPQMSSISVDGGHNQPSDANSADGEVALDLEVVGAAAPGAKMAVYFAPNTNRGFVDAVAAAIHDTVHRPSAISISWGQAEKQWPAQYRTAMDELFRKAAMLGITICAASGDHGTNDFEAGAQPGTVNVDYPAASDAVLACGGTMIDGNVEQSWNEGDDDWMTGGGISELYPVPPWQQQAKLPNGITSNRPGRGVPDVAGCAANLHVVVDGDTTISGGTSAVAPLWAALIARINQLRSSRLGFINPKLYAAAGGPAFTDIEAGKPNAAHGAPGYPTGPGWDACTGLGVPVGFEIAKLF